MDRPSFQFYPGDWQSNKNLRRCTHAEKGIWIDVLCLMHDSEEYGVLRWPLNDIAQAVGCKATDLQALRTKDVLKGAEPGEVCPACIYTPRSGRQEGPSKVLIPEQDGPVWYSSRMVKDEHKRQSKGDESRFGTTSKTQKHSPSGSPSASPTGTPIAPEGDGSSSSSSSSSSLKKDNDLEEEAAFTIQQKLARFRTWLNVNGVEKLSVPLTGSKWERYLCDGFPLETLQLAVTEAVEHGVGDVPVYVYRMLDKWSEAKAFTPEAVRTHMEQHRQEIEASKGGVKDGRRSSSGAGTPDSQTPGTGLGRPGPPAARTPHSNLGGSAEGGRRKVSDLDALSIKPRTN